MNKRNQVLFPDNKNGLYLYEYPMINGIRQYVQIRGNDKRNPILLFVHGGPGGSLAGICNAVQAGWEEKMSLFKHDYKMFDRTYTTMMEYNFKQNPHFEIPLLFVFGSEDYVCHASLFEKIFSEISAPKKKLAVIENAGHSCFFDQSETFYSIFSSFVHDIKSI